MTYDTKDKVIGKIYHGAFIVFISYLLHCTETVLGLHCTGFHLGLAKGFEEAEYKSLHLSSLKFLVQSRLVRFSESFIFEEGMSECYVLIILLYSLALQNTHWSSKYVKIHGL